MIGELTCQCASFVYTLLAYQGYFLLPDSTLSALCNFVALVAHGSIDKTLIPQAATSHGSVRLSSDQAARFHFRRERPNPLT
jgi:hypothetical protein